MACYILQFVLKICTVGLIKEKKAYFRDFWNVYDFIILVLYILHLNDIISFDPSPFNMIRLLNNLGDIFTGLFFY